MRNNVANFKGMNNMQYLNRPVPRWVAVMGLVAVVFALFGCGLLSADLALIETPTPDIASAPTLSAPGDPSGAPNPAANPTAALPPLPSGGPLLQPTGNLENDIRAVADRVRPGVVFIGIEASLRSFSEPVPVGNGSGVIIDKEGHVVTNNHVVENAQALKVTLPDGRTFDARLVGRDPATDLAVIKIPASQDLPVIPMGDSRNMRVGDWVVAIGNALGLEGGPTLTSGVVSALNRSITEENGATLAGLIQTDAAINPGNSGGALVNLRGELVGINTAVPGPTGQGFQPSGIGFAIAVNEAKPIIQQLLASGRVVRPFLGVGPVTLTPAIRSQLGVNADKGVVLASVDPNSPAARAGLREGDVIIVVDGKPIVSESELRQAIQAHRVGDTMEITAVRGNRQFTARAQLAESPSVR